MEQISVDEIVRGIIHDDLGRDSLHSYDRLLGFALRGVKKIAFDAARGVKTVSIDLLPNKTIQLPDDYVDYVKIGIQQGDKVLTFTCNNDLALLRPTERDGETFNTPEDAPKIGEGVWFYNYFDGTHTGRIYGYGSGRNPIGYFRVDREKCNIAFSGDVEASCIYMEYITNGLSCDCNTTIHPFFEETLIAWILWHYHKSKDNISLARMEETRYKEELRLARRKFTGFTKKDLMETFRRHYKLSIKG
jgi:hypothetical protein